MKKIKLGYEIGTCKEVSIRPSHLIVTGVTQLSGKTTTMEALIKRSGLKAVVFKTKVGEKSFSDGIETPPFFRDRSDYEFVKSLIEAYAKEKLFLEKGTLMRLCKGSSSLVEIKQRVDDALAIKDKGKLRGLKEEIHTRLQHYLENLIPQIQYANFSNVLNLQQGVNIMNLERFTEEAQSLIIQAVATEVLNTMKDVIIVIPEAWKFLPQKYNNPCKRAVEAFIRQGAANNNFVWLDSQDMAGVDKIPLKQISTWILGYQSERNEVKHTLDQISLPKKSKPKEDAIMNLRKGHFFISSYDGVQEVYVQPVWLDDGIAKGVADGIVDIEDVKPPTSLTPIARNTSSFAANLSRSENSDMTSIAFDDSHLRSQIIELRTDFFNKIEEINVAIQNIHKEFYATTVKIQELSSGHGIDTNEIVSVVLQKMPNTLSSPQDFKQPEGITDDDKERIIQEVVKRVPKTGVAVYKVSPLEMIKRRFLQDAKTKILADIEGLSCDDKTILKYLESQGKDISPTELVTKALLLKIGGSQSTKVSLILKNLRNIEVAEKTAGGRNKGCLKGRIVSLMGNHTSSEEEIDNCYNHILAEMLDK